ncbi:MAG: hypothetical protein HOP06_10125 [Methylotenera sp.]|nr:hypothetical protein [Methylotenera sp.]
MQFEILHGDIFPQSVGYFEADGKTPASLAGYSIKAQMRDAGNNLVHEFVPTVTDMALGKYEFDAFSTETLALGNYFMDIVYIVNGQPQHTETIAIKIVKTITRP